MRLRGGGQANIPAFDSDFTLFFSRVHPAVESWSRHRPEQMKALHGIAVQATEYAQHLGIFHSLAYHFEAEVVAQFDRGVNND